MSSLPPAPPPPAPAPPSVQYMSFPQSQQSSDSSGLMVVGLVLVLAVAGFLVWWFMFRKKEGKVCKPTTKETVANAEKYKYDAKGNCVVSNCLAAYSLLDNTCVENMDCEIQWPSTFTPDSTGSGCSQTAEITSERNGNGQECPNLTRSFSATDANCIALKMMTDMAPNAATDSLIHLYNTATPSVLTKLSYGSIVWSPNLSRVSPYLSNTVVTGATSRMITFAAAGVGTTAASNNITHNSNVIVLSFPDLSLLKCSSAGVLSNTTPAVTFSSSTDYDAAIYNDYKFMTSNSVDSSNLILISRVNSSNTFTIPAANIMAIGLSHTYTDPAIVLPYSLGKNASCPAGSIIGTVSTASTASYSGCAAACNDSTLSPACTAFQYVPGTTADTGVCNKYSGEVTPSVDYTATTGLSGGYCAKKNTT
jgi:hypothetical protein